MANNTLLLLYDKNNRFNWISLLKQNIIFENCLKKWAHAIASPENNFKIRFYGSNKTPFQKKIWKALLKLLRLSNLEIMLYCNKISLKFDNVYQKLDLKSKQNEKQQF